jgi:hypothetical protein
MGGSSGSSKSTSVAEIPSELRPLYSQTGTKITELQNQAPLTDFTGSNPLQVAPLSGTQQQAIGNINQELQGASGPLEQSPTVQAGTRYYQSAIQPGVENQATLSGLGRSTALTNALATTQAQTMLPLFEQEQQRRERMAQLGLTAGATERGAAQDVNTAQYQDYLRRQGLSEQATFGPLGQLPSTFGSQVGTKTSTTGGGLFKVLLPWVLLVSSMLFQ